MTTTEPRVIVVTGAGSGIGRAVARELLARGHVVVLAGRRAELLAETAEGYAQALCTPTDITDPESVRALFRAIADHPGRVDVLFNNAGVFPAGQSIDTIDDDTWNAAWQVNVSGAVWCAREAVRMMKEAGGGRVINNASISAHTPRPESVAYTTTKHAIAGLTKSIALDGRAHNITATRLDIGNAATDMTGAFVNALQPDGSRKAEPTFDPVHVARLVADVVALPNDVAVPELMVMAAGMPFIGRG
ncbi:MAG TPA: SDR family oxidoreductase [Propionibacterium sp.]|jgi:NAD(P)-dependent dehydrogenase (short-subunit alcohol dehydrogenase family)|nr:SDR family oxidoreductase [Propionibacterium sp.]